MLGLFLMLFAGVALIQDKRFFSSAPKAVLDAVRPKPERFAGQHALGWAVGVAAILIMAGAFVCGGYDGVKNGFAFWEFFLRFIIMLSGLKAFDVLFFDFFLLCRSSFFPRYYPETKAVLGPHLFGYNKKTHLIHILCFVPAALLLAWLCAIFV
ncbi:MAG: hypothetical protein K6G71_05310 [Clostridiales bacterium]|nr:hypothetical protein [Clostridiales bacterium]